jgi:hypothetical protein
MHDDGHRRERARVFEGVLDAEAWTESSNVKKKGLSNRTAMFIMRKKLSFICERAFPLFSSCEWSLFTHVF